MPIPKGFYHLSKDLDVDLFVYDAHVAGLVQRCLSGHLDGISNIYFGSDLTQRMEACEEKLQELIAYKTKLDSISKLLAQYIETLSNH